MGILADRTVAVAGAGRGLGRAEALECARQGAAVVAERVVETAIEQFGVVRVHLRVTSNAIAPIAHTGMIAEALPEADRRAAAEKQESEDFFFFAPDNVAPLVAFRYYAESDLSTPTGLTPPGQTVPSRRG